MTGLSVLDLPDITAEMARDLALSQQVCIRPLVRRVHDRQAGTEQHVALPCGATREAVCPPCASKARRLRMQQCAEGWHRTDEPDRAPQADLPDEHDQDGDDQDVDDQADVREADGGCGRPGEGRTFRTCPA